MSTISCDTGAMRMSRGVAHAAVCLVGAIRSEESGLGCEVLGRVGRFTAREAGVVPGARVTDGELGAAQPHAGVGQREGESLVLADRAIEHHALVRVRNGAVERDPTYAERLSREQYALGVQPLPPSG